MNLSSDLISQFVKVTNDSATKKTEKTVYGTTVEQGGVIYVRFDGSTTLTPVKYTANIGANERVMVQIKNHTATVIGNITSPSARMITHGDGRKTVEDIDLSEFGGLADRVLIVEQLVADKVSTDVVEAISGRIDDLEAEHVTINGKVAANEADISDLQSDNVSIKERLTAAEAVIEDLDTEHLDAKYATIENLNATNADIYNLEATYAEFVKTTTESLEADKASIKDLQAQDVTITGRLDANEANISDLIADTVTITGRLDANDAAIESLQTDKLDATSADITYAKITDLDASNAKIGILETDVADIDTLIFGSASGSTIQTSFANAVVAQLGNAQIKSAMIESISAEKITAGDISTNNVRVISDDGKLLISDETIQISDDNRVRVQIGKDAANDYSINIWDDAGKLMFSKGGITDSAIKEAIIRNDMVKDDANISASKLDIDSLFTEINGSNKTIKSSKIFLDDKNQTLDVEFISMTDEVNTVRTTANTAIANAVTAQSSIDNLEIGGRNLLLNTTTDLTSTSFSGWQVYLHDKYPFASKHLEKITKGQNLTARAYINNESGTEDIGLMIHIRTSDANREYQQLASDDKIGPGESGWVTVTGAVIITTAIDVRLALRHYTGEATSSTASYHSLKLELGNKATDWTPAPEDVESDISDAQDTADQAKSAASTNASNLATLTTKVTTQGTEISAIQGQISSKIWEQDIETAIDGIEVGGRNLLLDSSKISSYIPATGITVSTHADGYLQVVAAASNGNYVSFYCNERDYTIAETSLSEGDEFVLSFTMRSPDSTLIPDVYIKSGMGYYDLKGRMSSEWSTVWYAGIWQDANPIDFHLGFSGRPGTYEIKNIKLEKGNKATDWTPAPEDVEGAVTTLDTKYSELKQSTDGVAITVGQHTTELTNKAGRDEVTAVSDRVTSVEADLSGFKTTVSNTYAPKHIPDTRNNNQTPEWYFTNYPRQVVTEFKLCEVIGLSGDTYCSLTTTIPWADKSGGYPKQVARVNQKEYWRVGTSLTEWGAWSDPLGVASDAQTRVATAETKIDQNAEAITLRATKTELSSAIDGIEVGGRNLLLNSGVEVSNNEYLVYGYVPSSPLIEGEQYTVSMCVTPASGVSHLTLYLSDGSSPRVTLWPSGTDRQILTDVFTAGYYPGYTPDVNIYYAITNIYRFPNDGTVNGNTTIHWIKIEKGNKATDWTPAPEDSYTKTETDALIKVESDKISSVVSDVNTLGSRTSTLEQTADGLSLTLNETAGKIDKLSIGGRNLFTGIGEEIITLGDYKGVGSFTQFYNKLSFDPSQTAGERYIISLYARSPNGETEFIIYNDNNNPRYFRFYRNFGTIGTEWLYCTYTFVNRDRGDTYSSTYSNCIEIYAPSQLGVQVKNIKIEKGNKAADWTPAPEDVDSDITNASKTATDFMSYDATNGLQVGNKSSGSWSGTRAQILPDSFNILDADGITVASYGKDLIELGKGSWTSRIQLCDNRALIWMSTDPRVPDADFLYLDTDYLSLRGWDRTTLYSSSHQSDDEWFRKVYVETIGDLGVHLETSGYKINSDERHSGSSLDVTLTDIITLSDNASFTSRYGTIIDTVSGDINIRSNSGNILLESTGYVRANNKFFISADEKTGFNDGIAGWYFGTDGTTHVTHATSGSGIYFHYKGSTTTTSRIVESASGTISINGMSFGTNKVLWSGGAYMDGTQSITLSEAVSAQANGIVLIFSAYSNGASKDFHWSTHFVPKYLATKDGGGGTNFLMSGTGNFADYAAKYLYINDTVIAGHANNKSAGTGECGIKYNNTAYVLRYVIGV